MLTGFLKRAFSYHRIIYILIFLLFVIKGLVFLDPDFGWHLKIGEYTLKHGIPQTDPFSYSMPDFAFIDHEWLTNILIYKIHSLVGIPGLSVIFSALATLALLINLPFRNLRFHIFTFLLGSLVLSQFIGIRPQILSWVFLGLLLKILSRKKLFLTPILMIFWVNLHGSFPLLIVLLFIFNLFELIKTKRLNVFPWILLLISILTTFINPYGVRIWSEIWLQMSDTNLRGSILEWMPIYKYPSLGFFFALIVISSLVLKYWKKLSNFELSTFGLFLISAINTQRHLPLWLVIGLPLFYRSLESFYQDIQKIKFAPPRFWQMYKIFFIIVIFLFCLENYGLVQKIFKKTNIYPNQAISFLKTQNYSGNLFSSYGWGGYLIWQYPEKPVFIDGRMPSWRHDATINEKWAFLTYEDLVEGKISPQETFAKYNIEYVLFPKKKDKSALLDKYIAKIFKPEPQTPSFLDYLNKLKYEKIYEDETAVVYKFSPPPP